MNPKNQKKATKKLKMILMLKTYKSISKKRKKIRSKNITIQNFRQKIPLQMNI
jgi:hypothetical protein